MKFRVSAIEPLIMLTAVGLITCSKNSTTPDISQEIVNTDIADAHVVYDRILKAGPGDKSGRLPDCNQFKEMTGRDDEPVPGINCIFWGLRTWGRCMGATASIIVLADINDSVIAYYDGHEDLNKCQVYTGVRDEFVLTERGSVPITFDSVKYWKGEPEAIAGAAFWGNCEKTALCDFSGSEWYVQPGPSLLLMNADCCVNQCMPGYFELSAVYPVDDKFLYDWDGTAIPLDEARTLLTAGYSDCQSKDMPCTQPWTYDAIEPPDSSEETIEEWVEVE